MPRDLMLFLALLCSAPVLFSAPDEKNFSAQWTKKTAEFRKGLEQIHAGKGNSAALLAKVRAMNPCWSRAQEEMLHWYLAVNAFEHTPTAKRPKLKNRSLIIGGVEYAEPCKWCNQTGKCRHCAGTGKCPTCKGTGKRQFTASDIRPCNPACSFCNGGKKKVVCDQCKGVGATFHYADLQRDRAWLYARLSSFHYTPGMWQDYCGQGQLDGSMGFRKDPQKAYAAFGLAAKEKHPHGTFMLGTCLKRGWGTKPDPVAAQKHLTSAAQHGEPEAMLALAHIFLQKKDLGKAETWVNRAAYFQLPQAFYLQAYLLDINPKIPKEQVLAVLRKAAAAGHADAAAVIKQNQPKKDAPKDKKPPKQLLNAGKIMGSCPVCGNTGSLPRAFGGQKLRTGCAFCGRRPPAPKPAAKPAAKSAKPAAKPTAKPVKKPAAKPAAAAKK